MTALFIGGFFLLCVVIYVLERVFDGILDAIFAPLINSTNPIVRILLAILGTFVVAAVAIALIGVGWTIGLVLLAGLTTFAILRAQPQRIEPDARVRFPIFDQLFPLTTSSSTVPQAKPSAEPEPPTTSAA